MALEMLMAGKRAVVTGGCGFIGSHLVEKLLDLGMTVHVLDSIEARCCLAAQPAHPHLIVEKVNVGVHGRDEGRLRRAISEADLVFHLASPVGVRMAHEDRFNTTRSILQSGVAVISACQEFRRPILFASSSEVYGGGNGVSSAETDTLVLGIEPRRGYAAAKHAVEHLVLGLHQQFGVPSWAVRIFNVAGPRQRPEAGVVAAFSSALIEGRPIVINGDGSQRRAFLHVKDAVEGFIAIIGARDLVGRVVNLGGSESISVRELADIIVRVSGHQAQIMSTSLEDAFGDGFVEVQDRYPDTSLIHRCTNWRSRYNVEDAVRDCINFLTLSKRFVPDAT